MPAKRILLIEDEPDSADLLALGLQSAGYTVDVAGTVSTPVES
jgi:DNA-binding response OmpR family regulator